MVVVGINSDTPFVIVLGCCFLFGGVLLILIDRIKKKIKIKEYKKREMEMRKKYSDLMPGDYLFPVERFYIQCKNGKWTKTDNDIHVRKMVLIAKKLLEDDKIESQSIYKKYTSKEQVIKFFELMHEKELEKKKKEQAELEKKRSQPQDTQLGASELQHREFNEKCKNYKYLEKRREHLKHLIDITEKQVRYATGEFNRARKISSDVYNSKKGKDWAIAGGIANAIAGPAAGVMVATEVIKENERKRNNPINQLTQDYAWEKTSKAANNLSKIEKEWERYKRELKNVDSKLVFEEVSSEELYKHLNIKAEMSGGFGRLKLSVKNDYPENTNIKTVIDGTLQVSVYCNEILLDDVCVALPYDGVGCNKTRNIYTYLKSVIIDYSKYRFEIKPNLLWLMEK